MPCFEMPSRADIVLARIQAMGLGAVQDYTTFGLGPVKRLHRSDFWIFWELHGLNGLLTGARMMHCRWPGQCVEWVLTKFRWTSTVGWVATRWMRVCQSPLAPGQRCKFQPMWP